MTQPAPVDEARPLYAAVEIAKINSSEHITSSAQVVEDARTIHTFLSSGQACGSTES